MSVETLSRRRWPLHPHHVLQTITMLLRQMVELAIDVDIRARIKRGPSSNETLIENKVTVVPEISDSSNFTSLAVM